LLWDLVRHEPSLPFLLGATLLAFLLGGYHALSPGHGKTMVAAYLVGNRSTVKQAILLAGTVTFAHTFSIALLGLAVLLVFGQKVPDQVYPYLNLGAGIAIACVGGYLLLRRNHSHGHHREELSHADSNQAGETSKTSLGTLLTLGITSGIVPCPTALVVLLLSVSQGRPILGLYLVLCFGLGLAAVLAAIGTIAVKARARLDRFRRAKRLAVWLPRVSASVIILVGLAIASGPLLSLIRGR
jgi:ABC-type nickel/cobalt efflux system permease component RcnA